MMGGEIKPQMNADNRGYEQQEDVVILSYSDLIVPALIRGNSS